MAQVTKQRPTKKKRPVSKVTTRSTRKSSAAESFLDGIRPVGVPTSGIKMALYGKSATGKTTFACTFPGKKLLIRCGMDDGERSIYNIKDVEVTPLVKKSTDLDEIIKHQRSTRQWDTIILDTASEFRRVCLSEILDLDEVPTQLSWGIADRQQYGGAALGTKNRIRDLLDFAEEGTNVIIVAQESNAGEVEAVTDLLAPSVAQDLGGSTVGFLNPACDYVVQTFIRPVAPTVIKKKLKSGKIVERTIRSDEYEYCLRTKIHDVFTIKFRAPRGAKIPDVIVDPDYEKFYKLISK